MLSYRREHRPRSAGEMGTKVNLLRLIPALYARGSGRPLDGTIHERTSLGRASRGEQVRTYIAQPGRDSLAPDDCTDTVLACTGLATPVRRLCPHAWTHNPRRLRLGGAVSVADSWRTRRESEACTADRTMSRMCRTCSSVSTNYLSLYAASDDSFIHYTQRRVALLTKCVF